MQKSTYERYILEEYGILSKSNSGFFEKSVLCYHCKRIVEATETYYSIFCQANRDKSSLEAENSLLAFHVSCFLKLAGVELMSEWLHEKL